VGGASPERLTRRPTPVTVDGQLLRPDARDPDRDAAPTPSPPPCGRARGPAARWCGDPRHLLRGLGAADGDLDCQPHDIDRHAGPYRPDLRTHADHEHQDGDELDHHESAHFAERADVFGDHPAQLARVGDRYGVRG
jgi:hypothetical protein